MLYVRVATGRDYRDAAPGALDPRLPCGQFILSGWLVSQPKGGGA